MEINNKKENYITRCDITLFKKFWMRQFKGYIIIIMVIIEWVMSRQQLVKPKIYGNIFKLKNLSYAPGAFGPKCLLTDKLKKFVLSSTGALKILKDKQLMLMLFERPSRPRGPWAPGAVAPPCSPLRWGAASLSTQNQILSGRFQCVQWIKLIDTG